MDDNISSGERNREEQKKALLESILENRKIELYVEHKTKEMHVCMFCGNIFYRKPGKQIGDKWICIDCLRSLKEILDGLDQWEAEMAIEKEFTANYENALKGHQD